MPRELDTSRLSQFTPKPRKSTPAPEEKPKEPRKRAKTPEPAPEPWPSREPPQEGQFTIRAPLDEIARFRKICKDDRRTYADMLRILMDLYESKS